MIGLLYILVIIGGVLGFGGIVFMGTPLTAESAPLSTARAAIAMAFVVIPYCTARAIEQIRTESVAKRLDRHREWNRQTSCNSQPVQSGDSFFDYFFMPRPARDWQAISKSKAETNSGNDSNYPHLDNS